MEGKEKCKCEINEICVLCADIYDIKINQPHPNLLEEVEKYSLEQWSVSKWSTEETDRFNEGAQFYKELIEKKKH